MSGAKKANGTRARAAAAAALALGAAGCGEDAGRAPIRYQGALGAAVPVDLSDGVPVVQGAALDGVARPFVVDTGAPYLHLENDVYALERDELLRDVAIDAFGATLVAPLARGVNLQDDAAEYCLRFGGLIGGGLLHDFQLVGDYRAGTLALHDGLAGDPDTGGRAGPFVTVPATLAGYDRVIVTAAVEGVAADFLLDTGATFVSLAPDLAAELAGARPTLCCAPIAGSNAGAKGVVATRLARVRSLVVGDVAAAEAVPVALLPEDNRLLELISQETGHAIRGLIGGTFLRGFVFVVDYPAAELRLAPYREPDPAWAQEYVGPGFTVASDCDQTRFGVGSVWQDVDLAAYDIRVSGPDTPGDLIEAIEGRRLRGLGLAGVQELIRALPVGHQAEFAIDRARPRRDTIEEIPIRDFLPAKW